jgi:L-alanine-DL-glutamate epimerase-like enolase superfamily enzyme
VIITAIDAIPVAYPEPNDDGAIRHLCLVRLTTEDGAVGWGESITQWPEASLATEQIINGLAPLLIGRSVHDHAELWRAMIDHTWWYGWRGGIAAYAVAALDLALWDARGKAVDMPVLELITGGAAPAHDRLPAIASAHAFHAEIDDLAADLTDWVGTGLHGVKIGFGKKGRSELGVDHDRDVAFVAAARKAIGDDAALIIDLGVKVYWDADTAIARARAFEPYRLDWLEEPLGPWDPAGYRRLRDAVPIRLGFGEREWDERGYAEVLATGCVDVVGVDPARTYGLTGFLRIADAVRAGDRQLNAHAWSSAITTAASLAASLASPAARVFEVKPMPNPMQDELVVTPIRHDHGWVRPLPGPGLGIDVRDEVVAHYRYRPAGGAS